MRKLAMLLLLGALAACAAATRAGVARVDITPTEPIWMSGYANRNHPSTGVRLPLFARALAIDTGSGGRVVIVTTDLIGFPVELADKVAERARREFGIERARLVLNSSHTHNGPAVWPNLSTMFTVQPADETALKAYSDKLADSLVALIGKSIADLSPADITFGFGQVGFAMNRRQATPNGVRIGVNPAGPRDLQVPVLKVAGRDGKMRAILFAYACHNTTLGGDYYQIGGDYAGFAEAKLEAEYPGAAAMFMQLCAGDQNPEPRGTDALAQQHGQELAGEVDRVLKGELRPLRGKIRAAYSVTTLPFAPVARSVYEADLANPRASAPLKRRAQKMLDHPVHETAYPVQAIRFDKTLTLLALGGEVVVDYALRAKKEFPGEPLIVAAYSNSVMCYIPTERVLKEGGYEAVDNLIYYGQPGPFAPGVEQRVFDAIHVVMKKIGR